MLRGRIKFATVIVLVTLMITLSTNTASAWTGFKLLDIEQRNQEGDFLCWAACEQMICRYFGNTSITQYQIVNTLYNPVGDFPAGYRDISRSLSALGIASTPLSSAVPVGDIISQIENNQPIIACAIFHNGPNNSNYGHAVVIRGYWAFTDMNWYDVYWVDPRPQNDPYAYLAYSSFCSDWTLGSVYGIYM